MRLLFDKKIPWTPYTHNLTLLAVESCSANVNYRSQKTLLLIRRQIHQVNSVFEYITKTQFLDIEDKVDLQQVFVIFTMEDRNISYTHL